MLYSALPGSAIAFWGAVIAAQNLPAVTTLLRLLAVPVIGIVASNAIFGEAPALSLGIAVGDDHRRHRAPTRSRLRG